MTCIHPGSRYLPSLTVKEHPLHNWTKRELIRPAKKMAQKVTGSAGGKHRLEVRTEIQERERKLRELRDQVRRLEDELEQAPRKSREKERLRQLSRQRLLENQKMLNVSLVVTDARALEERRPVPLRRHRTQAKKEARLMFFLLLPICVALCYVTVKILLA